MSSAYCFHNTCKKTTFVIYCFALYAGDYSSGTTHGIVTGIIQMAMYMTRKLYYKMFPDIKTTTHSVDLFQYLSFICGTKWPYQLSKSWAWTFGLRGKFRSPSHMGYAQGSSHIIQQRSDLNLPHKPKVNLYLCRGSLANTHLCNNAQNAQNAHSCSGSKFHPMITIKCDVLS